MRARSGSRPAARRGVLILWLSVAAVVVLIFWGIARSFVTSSLRHESAAEVEGLLAEVLAESAVAEAEARIGYQVNALEGPLAEMLRRPVLAGEAGDLDLAPFVDLTQTKALLDTPGYRGYSVDEVTAQVVFQRQIDNVPTEKRALMVFTATSSSPGLVRRASRRLELGRWAKTTLTVVPRPFGLFGLFLADATGLTDPETVNRSRERALELTRQVRAVIAGRPLAGGPELLAEAFDPDGTAVPEPFALPDGAALYGLAESRAAQRLGHLDLGSRMRDLVDRAERAHADLSAQAANPGADPARLLETARTALAAAIAPLSELWTFQRNYAVLAPGSGQAAADLAGQVYKLDYDYFVRRAHYRLDERPGRTDLSTALKSLLDRQAQGVIALGNRNPVTVSGTVHGRVVIVVGPGGANVQSVNATEPTTGQVTIVCASGPLRISGRNAVSLILVDSPSGRNACQLRLDAGARIHGGLIATTLPSGDWREGELARDDRLFSGFTDPAGEELGLGDRFFVGLSPLTYYRRMVRP